MNILFTSDLSGLGGGETSLLNLCDSIKEANEIFSICACEGKLVEKLEEKDIETVVLNYRDKKRLLYNLLSVRKLIKGWKISCIHSNDPITSIIFKTASLGLGCKNFWTCHGQWYDFSILKKCLLKISNKHIFCVSTKVQENLIRMGFKNTSVTYLGVPIGNYQTGLSFGLRKKNNISEDSLLIGTVGRFQRIKGQLKSVKAVERLIQEGYRATLLLIGGCIYNNYKEKAYYEEIKKYITEHRLDDSVILLGEQSDIPSIMHELDVLVIPSDNESFGMVAIEAMASGLPVLSTPNDGVSEILDYKKNMIAESNDIDGLYKIIKQYIESSEDREDIRKYIDYRIKDFDISLIASKYMKVMKC